jgi:hypothetical protein
MNVQEFDTALSDLETRVDRLRALYENWFRGYEKMEPAVARKDVERRVYGLRKELPRNTALRFRYHQLYQRYTTLATYWQRTARQIEEGTHRLQLQRIKRRRVDDDLMRTNIPPPRDEDDATLPPPRPYELNLDETLDVQRLLEEVDIDQLARAIDLPASSLSTPPPRSSASSLRPGSKPSLVPAVPSVPPPASVPVPTVTSARFARPSAANDVLPIKPANGAAPAPPAKPPSVIGSPATGTSPGIPGIPKPPPLKIPAPGPGTGTMPTLPNPVMSTLGARGAPPLPGAPPPVPGRPPAVPPSAHGSAAVPPRAPAPPAPPIATRPVPPAAPVQPPVAARTAEGGPSAALSEQRLRRIYDEYVAARRKNNEGEVRYETLASSLQKMLPDLSKKHQGKQIDFEVVLKDGRVGIKPKAT